MSELQAIQLALERAARRRRWASALRGACQGLLVGAILSLLLAAAYHLLPLPLWTLYAAAGLPLPCALAGLVAGGWRKPNLQQVARWLDERQRLQARLSTALEMAGQPQAGTWRDLVVTDAAAHLEGIDPRKLLPLHLPKAIRWALVTLALVAGLGFVPEYRSKAYLQKQSDQRAIQETGKQLAELTRQNLNQRPPLMEPTQKALESVAETGDKLAKTPLTRSEALKDLANVAEKLKDELKQLGKDPALQKLQEAARNGTGNDSQSAASLQKQLDSLQKQLGSPNANPEALDKLKKELDKAQQAAQNLADNKNASGADAERQKLSASLAALSKQAQDMGAQMPQLDDAIKALENNQTDLFLKDLKAATTDLDKMREMAKSMQQLQQQAEKMGKDLAEQLQNGQPEQARQTLDKMINDLKSANLSPEQMQKMLQEVSKAVDPAGKYGKVGDHLQKATQQMKGNDKPGAVQSLAEASKELDKLMQQMADAQQLQESLEACNKASQCVGNGQCWGLKPGPPKAGQGGKPGAGVGTWADEGAQWNGEWTKGWDNSGVQRPDPGSARGQTDRGDGKLSDALQPTKVKGQFSPGGQMPSITLKGVSIKGQSKVDYEAAATAAQNDAQSALSQDKVPRAYQGAVKDYFDDLKK